MTHYIQVLKKMLQPEDELSSVESVSLLQTRKVA